ncbi:MAG TPA: hypothetical protein VIC07_11295 [Acidimicrobiia bacterium]|jgi:hypothetical protein
MGTEQESVETVRVVKSARPWTGFFLGLLFGISLAVVLQQAGVWPLDRLLLFGSAGLFALIGILLGGAGRQRASVWATMLPLILAIAMIAFGAVGLARVNDQGELHGGCTVEATSDVDSTVVTDTSRQDPFEIDPDGSLSWMATSPAPIMNHLWEIYVDVGGFQVVIADNEEPEPNTDANTQNSGDVADLSAYVEEVSNYAGVELAGVLLVGGSIDGEGGACDGFGFVHLVNDPLATLIGQVAAVVGLLSLIGLLFLVFNRTRKAEVVPDDIDAGGAGLAAAAATSPDVGGEKVGAHEMREETAAPAAPVGDEEGAGTTVEPPEPVPPPEDSAGDDDPNRNTV